LVDVKRMDCDFLACSAYKFYGPHIGILFGKKSRMESLDFPRLAPAPQESPERAETGTQNHEGIVGAAGAVEFPAAMAHDAAATATSTRRPSSNVADAKMAASFASAAPATRPPTKSTGSSKRFAASRSEHTDMSVTTRRPHQNGALLDQAPSTPATFVRGVSLL